MHSIYWSFDNTVCRLLKKGGGFNCSWLCLMSKTERCRWIDDSVQIVLMPCAKLARQISKFDILIAISNKSYYNMELQYRNTEIQPLTITIRLVATIDFYYLYILTVCTGFISINHCHTLYIAMKLNYETCITGGIGESKVILAPYRKWREVW